MTSSSRRERERRSIAVANVSSNLSKGPHQPAASKRQYTKEPTQGQPDLRWGRRRRMTRAVDFSARVCVLVGCGLQCPHPDIAGASAAVPTLSDVSEERPGTLHAGNRHA